MDPEGSLSSARFNAPSEPFDGPGTLCNAKASGEEHGDGKPPQKRFGHSPGQPRGQPRTEVRCRGNEMGSEPIQTKAKQCEG